ncbi:MAG: polysaccharide deacetylase family protein [Candidatus Sumerlaeaceae bacterium]
MKELFVHVDLDDLWAIGECYGLVIPQRLRHFVYEDGLPRLLELLRELGMRATFFVCGADLEDKACASALAEVLRAGHQLANHSYSHDLGFRDLSATAMRDEILRTHRAAEEHLGIRLRGFRAPGYGWSQNLVRLLAELGYLYDSSLMPNPFGGVFRFFDARLTRKVSGRLGMKKTQFPRLWDAAHRIRPFEMRWADGIRIWELPVATAPLLRLPMQGSVCLQLGPRYFGFVHGLLRVSGVTPVVFLLHGSDVTDFARLDLDALKQVGYFSMSAETRMTRLRAYLTALAGERKVCLAEQWFEERASCL